MDLSIYTFKMGKLAHGYLTGGLRYIKDHLIRWKILFINFFQHAQNRFKNCYLRHQYIYTPSTLLLTLIFEQLKNEIKNRS